MSLPLVSIITPSYNREAFIPQTIDSIIKQDYEHWEMLIVDDGSSDQTVAIVEQYAKKDKRIKLYDRTNLPKGAQTCRNIGLEEARGKYVIFLDSDDLLETFCLSQRISFFENQHPDKDFLVFPGLRFNIDKYDLNLLISTYRDAGKNVIPLFLNRDVPWLNFNPIYKRETLLQKNIIWNEKIKIYQDILFHVTCVTKGLRFEIIPTKPDCFWRANQSGDNIGSKSLVSAEIINSMSILFKELYNLTVKETNNTDNILYYKNFVFDYFYTLVLSNSVSFQTILHFIMHLSGISKGFFFLIAFAPKGKRTLMRHYRDFVLGKNKYIFERQYFLKHKYA